MAEDQTSTQQDEPKHPPKKRAFSWWTLWAILLLPFLGLIFYLLRDYKQLGNTEQLALTVEEQQRQIHSVRQNLDQTKQTQETQHKRWETLEKRLQETQEDRGIQEGPVAWKLHLKMIDSALRLGQPPAIALAEAEKVLIDLKNRPDSDGRVIAALEQDLAVLRQYPEVDRQAWLERQRKLSQRVTQLKFLFDPKAIPRPAVNTASPSWWQRWVKIERIQHPVPEKEKLISYKDQALAKNMLLQRLQSVQQLFIAREYGLVKREMEDIQSWFSGVFRADDEWDAQWRKLLDIPNHPSKPVTLAQTMRILES